MEKTLPLLKIDDSVLSGIILIFRKKQEEWNTFRESKIKETETNKKGFTIHIFEQVITHQ